MKATYPLELPVSIKKPARRLAKEDGVSLNQWIAAAVAPKMGVVETATDFFKKRAGKATGANLPLSKLGSSWPSLFCALLFAARSDRRVSSL